MVIHCCSCNDVFGLYSRLQSALRAIKKTIPDQCIVDVGYELVASMQCRSIGRALMRFNYFTLPPSRLPLHILSFHAGCAGNRSGATGCVCTVLSRKFYDDSVDRLCTHLLRILCDILMKHIYP
jgi:hypothetical protein